MHLNLMTYLNCQNTHSDILMRSSNKQLDILEFYSKLPQVFPFHANAKSRNLENIKLIEEYVTLNHRSFCYPSS